MSATECHYLHFSHQVGRQGLLGLPALQQLIQLYLIICIYRDAFYLNSKLILQYDAKNRLQTVSPGGGVNNFDVHYALIHHITVNQA